MHTCIIIILISSFQLLNPCFSASSKSKLSDDAYKVDSGRVTLLVGNTTPKWSDVKVSWLFNENGLSNGANPFKLPGGDTPLDHAEGIW